MSKASGDILTAAGYLMKAILAEPTSSADVRDLFERALDAYLARVRSEAGAARIQRAELAGWVERLATLDELDK